MLIVPTQPIANQRFNVLLGGQSCTIRLAQRRTGLFLDLYVNNALVLGGVVCRDRDRIVRDAYLGFSGDLTTIDTQGASDPTYAGLGSRYVLAYLDPADLT